MRAIDNTLGLVNPVAGGPYMKPRLMRLGEMKTGARARIVKIGGSIRNGVMNSAMSGAMNGTGVAHADTDTDTDTETDTEARELEHRFLEMGFEEGGEITLAHAGPIGRDPLAVRMNGTLIALRRRDAMRLTVALLKDPA